MQDLLYESARELIDRSNPETDGLVLYYASDGGSVKTTESMQREECWRRAGGTQELLLERAFLISSNDEFRAIFTDGRLLQKKKHICAARLEFQIGMLREEGWRWRFRGADCRRSARHAPPPSSSTIVSNDLACWRKTRSTEISLVPAGRPQRQHDRYTSSTHKITIPKK